MKKMLSIVVVMAMVLVGYSVTVKAASVNLTVPLTFTVAEGFGFTLDTYSYDFGTILPGKGAEKTIGISCRSNHSKVWYMDMQANQFASGGNVMPSNPGFIFAGWSNDGPEKAQNPFAASGPVPVSTANFYTSTLAEGADSYVPLSMGLYINVPAGQVAGYYTTNLVLTMHD